ncbi:ROK family transcriptional regulator [Mycetocola tolaasinivorans]|nr:ROK family transcriptional regulator [Mycetocola tolaasinivorans]
MNRASVLSLIRDRAPISQSDIVTLTGLGKATVSSIIAELVADAWLLDVGAGAAAGTRGGRRTTLLKLDPRRGFVVGVKILEGAVALVVTDLEAQVVFHDTTPVRRGRSGYTAAAVLETTVDRVNAAIGAAGIERSRVLGVGVGVTGLVDGPEGVGYFSRLFPDEPEFPLGTRLSEALNLPVTIENDVNTLAVAERWFGVGRGVDDFAVVTIGRGIGAGLIVHGTLVKGIRGGAGELGHIKIQSDGPLCECGRRGCLQANAADPAVVAAVTARLAAGEPSSLDEHGLTITRIIAAADEGDLLARDALGASGAALGRGIAQLINILAPEKIIVSGEGIGDGPWRVEPMLKAIRGEAFDQVADAVDIQVERLGFEAWARGAACVVLGQLFDSPVNEE